MGATVSARNLSLLLVKETRNKINRVRDEDRKDLENTDGKRRKCLSEIDAKNTAVVDQIQCVKDAIAADLAKQKEGANIDLLVSADRIHEMQHAFSLLAAGLRCQIAERTKWTHPTLSRRRKQC